MKALFIGVGSIGTRHIIDFYEVCKKYHQKVKIHVLRREIKPLPTSIENIVEKQIVEIDDLYDVIFITNPTNLHYDAIKKTIGLTKYYFVEKPIFEDINYNYEELGLNEENTYVAAPMRHTKIYKRLKSVVSNTDVYAARVICSSYLPDWRPTVDYRQNYSAKREMGGGVSLDLVHEIDYMLGLFGLPKKVFRMAGKFSHLEITSDDLSTYLIEYEDKICEVHLDYFGRKYCRTCELFTQSGTIFADFGKETIKMPDGSIENCKDIADAEFKHEMDYFFRFINGNAEIVNSPKNAYNTVKIALGKYGD